MSHRITSDRLRTIEDVRRERWRVEEELERQRCLLRYDRELIEEVLSPDYWAEILSAKAAGVVEGITGRLAARLRGGALGAGVLSRIVNRLTRRLFNRPSEGEYYYIIEEEFDEPPRDPAPGQTRRKDPNRR